MGHCLELLVEEMKYYETTLDVYNKELTLIKINDVKQEYNQLFDQQLDLFFEIKEHNTKRSRDVMLEINRPHKV